MGLFSENKCTRCDRRYSGLKGRCPYCGARKSKRSKKNINNDKVGLKVGIGIALMVLLMAAVAVILVFSLTGENADSTSDFTDALGITNNTDVPEDGEPEYSVNEGVTSTPSTVKPEDTQEPDDAQKPDAPADTPADDTDTQEPADTQEPDMAVTITWLDEPVTDFTLNIGETLSLGYTTTKETTSVPEWTIDDSSIASVLPTGEVAAIASGSATITVTIDGASAECIVRVN